jgi:hypothetical protein
MHDEEQQKAAQNMGIMGVTSPPPAICGRLYCFDRPKGDPHVNGRYSFAAHQRSVCIVEV